MRVRRPSKKALGAGIWSFSFTAPRHKTNYEPNVSTDLDSQGLGVHFDCVSVPHDDLLKVARSWLDIPSLANPTHVEANVSVTCSEAEALRRLAWSIPYGAAMLRDSFRQMNPADKADDDGLRRVWKSQTRDVLADWNYELSELEAILGHALTNERVAFPTGLKGHCSADADPRGEGADVVLSSRQLDLLFKHVQISERWSRVAKRSLSNRLRQFSGAL